MPHYFIEAHRWPTDHGNTSLVALPDISTPDPQNTGAETPSHSSTPSSFPSLSLQADGDHTWSHSSLPHFFILSPLFSSVLSSGSNATASLLCPISSKIPLCSPVREGHLNACGWDSQNNQAEEHQFCLPWSFCLSQPLVCLTALFMQPFCCSLPALTNLVLTSWSPGAPPPLPSTDTCAADGTNGLAIIQCLSIGLPCLVLVMVARQG